MSAVNLADPLVLTRPTPAEAITQPQPQASSSSSSSSLRHRTTTTNNHYHQHNNMDARFSCNICLDAVSEPVVTQCGHLYCWPCLYKWLEPGMYPCERARLTGIATSSMIPPDSSHRACPVCKASCSVNTIVPIYVRTDAAITATASSASPHRQQQQQQQQQSQQQQQIQRTVAAEAEADREEEEDELQRTNSSINQSAEMTDDEESSHDEIRPEPTSIQVPTGLRQRRTTTSNTTTRPEEPVPRRPTANSPAPMSPTPQQQQQQQQSMSSPTTAMVSSSSSNNSVQLSPPSATLATGMLPLLQEAMRRTTGRQNDAFVPTIHRPEGFHSPESFDHNSNNSHLPLESDPGATEFLSRLLLMLGSFVIMCLLLF